MIAAALAVFLVYLAVGYYFSGRRAPRLHTCAPGCSACNDIYDPALTCYYDFEERRAA